MKLRNKKTGEIGDLQYTPDKEYHFMIETEDPADIRIYKTLAELNEEWEDYEDQKEYWYINNYDRIEKEKGSDDAWFVIKIKQIGNYFESKEEAEKAVEKLKAWKRLKDKGFRFNNFVRDVIYYEISDEEIEKNVVREDLNLLFGGEE